MPPSPRFFFEPPMPTPSPMEGISMAMGDFRTPNMTPEAIEQMVSQRGPEVMRNLIANVGQNRTIPAATESIQFGLDSAARERIAEIVQRHPQFITSVFGLRGDSPPGLSELLSQAGQVPRGPNLMNELSSALLRRDTETLLRLTQVIRRRLESASLDPEMQLMGRSILDEDAAGNEEAENPLWSLMAVLDSIDANHGFRSAPGRSAGPARNDAARFDRNMSLEQTQAQNDPLLAAYDALEDSGFSPDALFRHLSTRLYTDFDLNADFANEGNLAPFLSRDRVAADITEAADPSSGLLPGTPTPDPYQPDIGLFFRSMGINR